MSNLVRWASSRAYIAVLLPMAATIITTGTYAKPAGETKTIAGLTGPATAKGEIERDVKAYQLEKDVPGLATHRLRSRYVDVEAGGIVPIHSHANRPAMYFIVSGDLMRHQSGEPRPIRQGPNSTSVSSDGSAHWWENVGRTKAVIYVVDVCPHADLAVTSCD